MTSVELFPDDRQTASNSQLAITGHLLNRAGQWALRRFALSRWRGRRYACDTSDIMGCYSILNRFSPSVYNSLFFCILQAKTDSIPIV